MLERYRTILKFNNYDQYKSQINEANRIGIELLQIVYIIVCLMNVIGRLIFSGLASFSLQMMGMLSYALLTATIYQVFLKKKDLNFTFLIFAFEIPVYLFSILMGTVFDAQHAAFTFLLIMIVFPLFIMAKPRIMIGYILLYSAAFLAIDYAVKQTSLFQMDLSHVINATALSVGAMMFTLVVRIRNFEYEREMQLKSITDPLTGAYNRDGGDKLIDAHKPGLFIFMDVDDFKTINDSFGHDEGDRVLIMLVHILKEHSDKVIRFGGDEFAVYFAGDYDVSSANQTLSAVATALSSLAILNGDRKIPVKVSAGAVISHGQFTNIDEMMKAADKQLYYVKTHGKGGYSVK